MCMIMLNRMLYVYTEKCIQSFFVFIKVNAIYKYILPLSLLFYTYHYFCYFFLQFCDMVKKIIRDQRSVVISAAVGMALTLCVGVGPFTALPSFLLTFTLWMAS